MIWDFQQPQQKVSNRPFYSHIVPASTGTPVKVNLSHLNPGNYRLRVHRTGFRANDAYSAYIDMGAPKELTAEQLEELRKLTSDVPEADRSIRVGGSGTYGLSLPMRSNDVVLITLVKAGK